MSMELHQYYSLQELNKELTKLKAAGKTIVKVEEIQRHAGTAKHFNVLVEPTTGESEIFAKSD